jgi:hypothetical protein
VPGSDGPFSGRGPSYNGTSALRAPLRLGRGFYLRSISAAAVDSGDSPMLGTRTGSLWR